MLKSYPQQRQAIAQAIAALDSYQISPQIQEQLITILDERDSYELYRFNPRAMADRLHLSEQEMLPILVMGLKEGIFTMNWEVECPVCHGLDARSRQLQDLHTLHTCPICYHIHANQLDDRIRVTFSIDERLRSLSPDADDPDFRARIDQHYGVVSGHRLLTLQTFRTLFPRETLPPNESLQVRRVAILFTDLTGSTALYLRRGDARAFDLVRQHFTVLFQIINAHNGVVVKTIGDAVMGAFTMTNDALAAAIAMHQQLAQLNQQLDLPPEDFLILKIGIDVGPCICVTLNDRLDYFGTTVNRAARIQSTSTGNMIAVSDDFINDRQENPSLNRCQWQQQDVILKGIDAPVIVHYLSPAIVN